ncbi:MAG TPA: NADPH-dependent FMN reductase [Candidatus Thermoplasmatota archaeon]|nr:NADPH-dependent FMN reductase [Candidatus Thermoplasmatota archaeon]
MYFPVLHGTSRAGNKSIRPAMYAARRLKARGYETRLFSTMDLPFGDLRRREWEMEGPRPEVREFVREMARADGFVLVFPEYNHGYPGALKNVLDHLYDEWNRKPFALVTAGGVSGGLRAQENLLPVIRALQGVVVPKGVAVASVGRVFGEDGMPLDPATWEHRFDAMVDDLAWWADALAAARAHAGAKASVTA